MEKKIEKEKKIENEEQLEGEREDEEKKRLSGIFSLQEVRTVGTGTTTRKTIQKSFWFAEEKESETVEVQLLNANYIPAGPKKKISLEKFLEKYSPEPEFYVTNYYPKMREINRTVARADRHRKNEEHYSAEMEYNNALKLDIENVRANFGLGLTYLERGENDKAENILERLVKLDATFAGEHKHLFNDFGINLRKSGMYKQAVDYYKRALDLSSKDENLHYNLARAHLECKEVKECIASLLDALELNPVHEISAKFLMWLAQKNLVPADQEATVLEALARVKKEAQSRLSESEGTKADNQAKKRVAKAPSKGKTSGEDKASNGKATAGKGPIGKVSQEKAKANKTSAKKDRVEKGSEGI